MSKHAFDVGVYYLVIYNDVAFSMESLMFSKWKQVMVLTALALPVGLAQAGGNIQDRNTATGEGSVKLLRTSRESVISNRFCRRKIKKHP